MKASSEDPTYWSNYFEETFRQGNPWLNYPNARCQAQTWALALEALGPVAGVTCLDVGCGHGQMSLILSALGADVVGVDFNKEAIELHRKHHPHIQWHTADLTDPMFGKGLGRFQKIVALEVLQYTNSEEGMGRLWNSLAPEGRIVGTVPNPECPIVEKTMQRFDGAYSPPDVEDLAEFFKTDPEVDYWSLRGVAFMSDQRIAPYVASSWGNEPSWPSPPNRVLFVAQKRAQPPAK